MKGIALLDITKNKKEATMELLNFCDKEFLFYDQNALNNKEINLIIEIYDTEIPSLTDKDFWGKNAELIARNYQKTEDNYQTQHTKELIQKNKMIPEEKKVAMIRIIDKINNQN